MKKIGLILIAFLMIISLTGCSAPSVSDLNSVNNKIIEYFSKDNVDYDNLCFNYVDNGKRRVIVGLIDNSKEQQDRFRKMVIDSEYLEFTKGERSSMANY